MDLVNIDQWTLKIAHVRLSALAAHDNCMQCVSDRLKIFPHKNMFNPI